MTAKGSGVWIDMPTSSFDGDEPMCCYDAWNCMFNLQHLVDSSGQYRVNTVASTGKYMLAHSYVGDPPVLPPPSSLSWEFPLTMMYSEHPPNFDIRVAAYIDDDTSDDATVKATLTALDYHHDIWAAGSATGRLYTASATVDSETASWVIDDQYIWAVNSSDYLRMLRHHMSTENGGAVMSWSVMVRFTVSIRVPTDSSQSGFIAGVQFREFA